MTVDDLTCGKCGEILIIDAAHVTFRDGKRAYIRCPNPKCNNTRRISWDMVEHLKPNSEAVKTIEEIHKYVEEHGIKPEESIKSLSAEPEPVKQETTGINAAEHEITEKEQENNSPEDVILGAIAAVIALIVSIVGILWYWYKNRKEGEAT